MIWTGRSVLQPRRSDWWKLHSELTDALVAPSASNTLSHPTLSYQHHIQSPLNSVDKLLNTASFFYSEIMFLPPIQPNIRVWVLSDSATLFGFFCKTFHNI